MKRFPRSCKFPAFQARPTDRWLLPPLPLYGMVGCYVSAPDPLARRRPSGSRKPGELLLGAVSVAGRPSQGTHGAPQCVHPPAHWGYFNQIRISRNFWDCAFSRFSEIVLSHQLALTYFLLISDQYLQEIRLNDRDSMAKTNWWKLNEFFVLLHFIYL